MLTYVLGNLFESPAHALVNTVNTQGVMGKGVALSFKQIFPEMFAEYRALCEEGALNVGNLHIWRSPAKVVVNFPTKIEWRNPSRIEYIEAGLKTFVAHFGELGIESAAFPPLGCGNGELNFERQVRPLMEQYLSQIEAPIYIYAPIARAEVAEHRQPRELREWLRSEPSEMPFGEVWADIIETLAHGPVVRSLSTQTPMTATMNGDESAILVRWQGGDVTIPHDAVRETWKRLRTHGIITHKMIIAENIVPLFPVLALLPYVKAVRLSTRIEELDGDRSWGIQLLPVTEASQRDLALRA